MARKITPLKLNESGVKAAIQADDAKRQARGVQRRAEKAAAAQAIKDAERARIDAEVAARAASKDVAAERAAYLKTMREDYEAGFEEGSARDLTFEQFLTDNGVNSDGSPMATADEPKERAARERHYFGPMFALVEASKHYVKGTNGNPHCADELAMALDGLTREQVVKTLGAFLFMQKVTESTNPYKHLNPGQQSMNLRNKMRGALKNGLVKMDALKLQIEAFKAEAK